MLLIIVVIVVVVVVAVVVVLLILSWLYPYSLLPLQRFLQYTKPFKHKGRPSQKRQQRESLIIVHKREYQYNFTLHHSGTV